MKPWLRNGVVFGVAAFVATMGLDLLARATRPSNICTANGLGLLLTGVSIVVFLVLAGAAGWRTTGAGLSVGSGSLAGLVTGAIAGLAVILYVVAFALPDAPAAVSCLKNRPGSVPTLDVFRTLAIVFASLIAVVGIGIGAAAGAIGGSIGQPRDTA